MIAELELVYEKDNECVYALILPGQSERLPILIKVDLSDMLEVRSNSDDVAIKKAMDIVDTLKLDCKVKLTS